MSDIRTDVQTWANHIGRKKAVVRLVIGGVSTRAAERLCAGEYESEPKSLKDILLKEMKKDGFPKRRSSSQRVS